MAGSLDVTVALCTRDRAPLLAGTLEHLQGLHVPPGVSWELIVVDNASEDDTPGLLARTKGLPLRALREVRDGKSHAANLATQQARGALLLWTDDDVKIDPGWLVAYLDAARRHPRADFFGGPVRPWFESVPPVWLRAGLSEVELPYALLDLGSTERPFAPHERCNGPNFALRTEVARLYPWNPERGPRHRGRLPGAESWVLNGMVRDGRSGVWVPEAVVEHFIPAASMTLDYVALRYRLHGRALMLENPGWGRAARSLASALLEATPRYLLGRMLGLDPRRWLRAFRRAQTHWGRLGAGFR